MSGETKNEFGFARFEYSADLPTAHSSNNTSTSLKTTPVDVEAITINIYVKFNYPELNAFVDELQIPQNFSQINGQPVPILHLYALQSTRDPIDMSNQKVRMSYQPNLFIRKNDMYGPWNFKYLLDILELDYQCSTNDGQFPAVWKSTPNTTFHVQVKPSFDRQEKTMDAETPSTASENDVTLLGLLKTICRQNKCDDSDATLWLKTLKEENINTIDHLRGAIGNESTWEKLTAVKHLVKQMIRDYVQLNLTLSVFNENADPYKDSKATLLADIHRVRRYFYHCIGHVHRLSYLDRQAVKLAIDEIRLVYDDDGNVLGNIQNYLRTFCLQNATITDEERAQQRQGWMDELATLEQKMIERKRNADQLHTSFRQADADVRLFQLKLSNVIQEEKRVNAAADKVIAEAREMAKNQFNSGAWEEKHNQGRRMRDDYQIRKRTAERELTEKRGIYDKAQHSHLLTATEVDTDKKKIDSLKELLELNLAEEQRKLKVKFGRGLLLYGPPGTGKSELLKRAAVFAGITMTTPPLAAGELNRPYVGETEKLLIDIMYRANTIPYLICAMTIDEIDGLVPKRDNNAQQSKVDGISVLLSHIEGVKNIPNLIVFGATNRRNMMDEAFLRRMQAKCFVGRPSPKIRKKMLRPLLSKNSNLFTNERLEFLVKVTTNFSGAAVGALKSSIIVAMDETDQTTLTNLTLLELADNAAREFSCWFGIGTLPEIGRMYPNLFSSENNRDHEQYSLSLPQMVPSGRILVDLRERTCLIELSNEPTVDRVLDDGETSMLTLIARFVHGCSTRNIDTIQIIDLNFLTKNNAFDENQIFELLTTTFLECNEYNRSMLIFDIDSLIMLTVSDSEMSKSESISNIRLYQFVREKCKTAIIEQQTNGQGTTMAKEKWVVIIVKHPLLRQLMIEDIEFKKTAKQLQKEEDDEKKRADDETEKICPKCRQNYIPSKTNYGNCRYHDGFVHDLESNTALNYDQAQVKATLQRAKPNQPGVSSDQQPKLIWACCLGWYGSESPCRAGLCGLPEELKETHNNAPNQIAVVQQHFMKNPAAHAKLATFLETYKKQVASMARTPVAGATLAATGGTTVRPTTYRQ